MELFTELNAPGRTIIVITHEEHEEEVAEYCARRIWLRAGSGYATG